MRLNERVDEEAELAELQRRAYGPAGDIDPAGARRLAELQERERRRRAVVPAPSGATAAAAAPTPQGSPAPTDPVPAAPVLAVPAVPEATAETDPSPAVQAGTHAPPDEAPRRPLRSRPAALLAIGAAAGVLVAGTIGAALAAGGAPDAELPIVDDDPGRGAYGIATDGRTHEEYHGITVQSLRRDGASCLAVEYELGPGNGAVSGRMGDMDCAPPGAVPTLAVWTGNHPLGWGRFEIDGLETGTFLRFELHGDVVEVWRFEPAPTPAPDQAQ